MGNRCQKHPENDRSITRSRSRYFFDDRDRDTFFAKKIRSYFRSFLPFIVFFPYIAIITHLNYVNFRSITFYSDSLNTDLNITS